MGLAKYRKVRITAKNRDKFLPKENMMCGAKEDVNYWSKVLKQYPAWAIENCRKRLGLMNQCSATIEQEIDGEVVILRCLLGEDHEDMHQTHDTYHSQVGWI